MTNWNEVTNDTKDFSLQGVDTTGKVVSVYDGDTLRICFSIHDTMYKWNCRVAGVDTPEIRTKNLSEKRLGYVARDALRNRVLNKLVRVECDKFDKYGRLLVKIYDGPEWNECVNDWLIQEDYAKSYDGGTKTPWVINTNISWADIEDE